jgi:hypothetical protein
MRENEDFRSSGFAGNLARIRWKVPPKKRHGGLVRWENHHN